MGICVLCVLGDQDFFLKYFLGMICQNVFKDLVVLVIWNSMVDKDGLIIVLFFVKKISFC